MKDCPKCNGSNVVDSGGVEPWGEGINIPCSECDLSAGIWRYHNDPPFTKLVDTMVQLKNIFHPHEINLALLVMDELIKAKIT